MLITELEGRYEIYFPNEVDRLESFRELLGIDGNPIDRYKYHDGLGHVTASGIVLSPDMKQMVLIDHIKLNKRLQPGGHFEPGDTNPLSAAFREISEETGASIAKYLAVDPGDVLVPLDIDTHVFTAHPATNQPEHLHHDIRYVFLASDMNLTKAAGEVSGIGWYDLEDVVETNIHLSGLVKKLINRLGALTPVAIDTISTLQ